MAISKKENMPQDNDKLLDLFKKFRTINLRSFDTEEAQVAVGIFAKMAPVASKQLHKMMVIISEIYAELDEQETYE